jgi:superfamily II DNA or RNA helicase
MKEVRKEIKETIVETKNPETLLSKEDIILKIIEGKLKKITKKEILLQIPGLLIGTEILPEPETKDRKFVIFSNHPDILKKICAKLVQKKIQYIVLEGTSKQRYEQVQEHKNNRKIPVIILNSMQACSGIDMPYLTDMIFCHDFVDKQIMGQASGRAQRMGRKYSMNYHYVFYDNETENFTYTEKINVPDPGQENAGNVVNQAAQPEQIHPPNRLENNPRCLTLREIRLLPFEQQPEARRLRRIELAEQRRERLRRMAEEEVQREDAERAQEHVEEPNPVLEEQAPEEQDPNPAPEEQEPEEQDPNPEPEEPEPEEPEPEPASEEQDEIDGDQDYDQDG